MTSKSVNLAVSPAITGFVPDLPRQKAEKIAKSVKLPCLEMPGMVKFC